MALAEQDGLKPIAPSLRQGQVVGYVTRDPTPPPELDSAQRWHILRVRPGQEADMAREVHDLGIGTYIAIEPVRRNRRGRRGHRFMPVFGGYLFVKFDPCGFLWHALMRPEFKRDLRCEGRFVALMIVAGHPVSLTESAMARIREIEALLLNCRIIEPMPIHAGQIVRIVDCGAFTGLFAPIVGVDAEKRQVRVQYEIMHKPCFRWLDLAHVTVV